MTTDNHRVILEIKLPYGATHEAMMERGKILVEQAKRHCDFIESAYVEWDEIKEQANG